MASDRAARVAGRIVTWWLTGGCLGSRAELDARIARAIRREVKRAVEEERAEYDYLGSLYGVAIYAKGGVEEFRRKLVLTYLNGNREGAMPGLLAKTDAAAIRGRK